MQNLSYCTATVNEISALADRPNAAGLTAAQLKAKFDASGASIKSYINNTLVPYINGTLVSAAEEAAESIEALQNTEHTHSNKTALDSYTKSMSELLLAIYPIGSIYISVSSTSPASLFGGTWERIKDVFLLAAGDTYEAGATGGEAAHTLTVAEMPSHHHALNTKYSTYTYNVGYGYTAANEVPLADEASGSKWTGRSQIIDEGGDQPHNNMPPYLSVYCWKRTA